MMMNFISFFHNNNLRSFSTIRVFVLVAVVVVVVLTITHSFRSLSELSRGVIGRRLQKRINSYGANPSDYYPLDRCEGDCDDDTDCMGILICYQRERFKIVPGCEGGEIDATPTDYCIDPAEDNMVLPKLKYYGRNPLERNLPLQECEGDCDSNSDCDAGLVCLQRRTENSRPVPGCSGQDNGLTDYCVKEAVALTVPQFESIMNFGLKLYWEDYRWQEEEFDRRWCMECVNGGCKYGDKTYIHTCERAISQKYDFGFIKNGANYAMIRVHGTSLCFERVLFEIFLYECDPGNRRQIWVGDFRSYKFEIKPFGLDSHCVTQRHHPKFYEEVEIEPCNIARHSETSYWMKY